MSGGILDNRKKNNDKRNIIMKILATSVIIFLASFGIGLALELILYLILGSNFLIPLVGYISSLITAWLMTEAYILN
jgi:hypothetical protein